MENVERHFISTVFIVDENKVLLMMLSYGISTLLISFAAIFIVFTVFSYYFMPVEIVSAAITSVLPWFLAGFAAYFLGALVTLEAVWKYRIFYVLASSAFILFFFENSMAGGYETMNLKLVVLTVLISLSLTFSAYRFRKGEM